MSNMDAVPRKMDINQWGDTLDARIRDIKAKGAGLSTIEERLKKEGKEIYTLDLHGLTTLTSQDFNFLAKYCPNIERLNINDCTPTIQSVAEVARLSKLEVLDMNRSLAHQNGVVSEILRSVYSTGTLSAGLKAKFKEIAATITEVDLHGVSLTKEALQEVITLFPNATKFNLSNCSLSNEHISLLSQLTKLATVDISQNLFLTSDALSDLAKCKALTNCNTAGTQMLILSQKAVSSTIQELVTRKAMHSPMLGFIKEHSYQITRLELQGVTLTAEQIKVISQVLPHLREISLKGCTLDSAAISELASFTALEKIEAPGNATIDKITKRQAQILQAKIEREEVGKLNPAQALKLANFMEVRLPEEVAKGKAIFTKKAYNLPRSLQYSAQEGGAVYLMAHHKISKIQATGGYKKVTSCAQFILKEYATAPLTFVRGLSKRDLHAGDFKLTQDEIALTRKLADEVRQKFPHLPMGILPLHAVRDFTNLKGVPRVSMISEAFDGDVFDLHEREKRLTLDNYLTLIRKAALGVYQLHSLGYVHADIKPDNFLFREDKQTKEIQDARLIDFGLCFRKGTEPTTDPGRYGTVAYTAPELFGVQPFTDDFQKADVFAFGITCYAALFGGFPRWTELIDEWEKLKTDKVSPELRAAIQDMIRSDVEVPLHQLFQKPHLTREDKVLMLIYQTMRLDPRQRIDMATFMRELQRLEEPAPQAESPKTPQSPPAAPGGPGWKKPPQAGIKVGAGAAPKPAPKPAPKAAPQTGAALEKSVCARLKQELESNIMKNVPDGGYEPDSGQALQEQDSCMEICRALQRIPVERLVAVIRQDERDLFTQAFDRLQLFINHYYGSEITNDPAYNAIEQFLYKVQAELLKPEAAPKPAPKPSAQPRAAPAPKPAPKPVAQPQAAPAPKPAVVKKEASKSPQELMQKVLQLEYYKKNRHAKALAIFSALYEEMITSKLEKDETVEQLVQRMQEGDKNIVREFLIQFERKLPAGSPDLIAKLFKREFPFMLHNDKAGYNLIGDSVKGDNVMPGSVRELVGVDAAEHLRSLFSFADLCKKELVR